VTAVADELSLQEATSTVRDCRRYRKCIRADSKPARPFGTSVSGKEVAPNLPIETDYVKACCALGEGKRDVFRLNFSHGSHEHHKARLAIIRNLEREMGLGVFRAGKVNVRAGQPFRLDPGNDQRAPLPHPEIFAVLAPQMNLLLDDGKVRLRVERCGPDFADTVVVTGGAISDRKVWMYPMPCCRFHY